MISRLRYTFGQALRQISRNRAMTVASIFAITAMLLILGIFFIIIINVNMAAEAIKDDYNTIEVFLLDETSEETAMEMEAAVKGWDNVESVKYRSKDEALKILKERWGNSGYLLDSLADNPLPNSLVITVADLEKSDLVAAEAGKLEGREDVKYYKDTVDKLLSATNFLQIAAIVIMGFLIIVSVVVVSNTIKLTVLNRAEEISIMKYVGATNWFIRGPFLTEGILIGGFSALLSAGVVALIYSRVIAAIGKDVVTVLSVPLVPIEFLTFNLVWIFLALGISIGAWEVLSP